MAAASSNSPSDEEETFLLDEELDEFLPYLEENTTLGETFEKINNNVSNSSFFSVVKKIKT